MAELARATAETITVNDVQMRLAQDLDEVFFSDSHAGGVKVELSAGGGHSVELPRQLTPVVLAALEAVRSGQTLSIGLRPKELTTTAAAKVLGVSRPTLVKMIRDGRIPARKVGTHHRVLTTDVLKLRDSRLSERRQAVFALMDLAQGEQDFS